MQTLVHVIGGGLAGLAAAVQLQRRGARVALHEATDQVGGRCRSYYDRTLNATIDSGNHLVLSGYRATLNYLRAVGASDELVGPVEPELPFFDLATQTGWNVRPSAGYVPWWIFNRGARVPGTQPTDYLALASLLFAKPGRTIARSMRCDGAVWDQLLRPLLRAVMNVEPADASAELACALARETFFAGGQACRPLVARNGLGSAFVDPALRLLQHGGTTIRLGSRLRAMVFDDATCRVIGLAFGDVPQPTPLAGDEAVVLAVPGDVAATLVPGLLAPRQHKAIATIHFAIDPPLGFAPITFLVNGTAERLHAHDGRLSVTVGDAARWLGQPGEALVRATWSEVARATGLAAEPLPAWTLDVEPRATFAALPDEELRRPGTRTRWTNLTIAGDWTATGLPATIEGAIRSGQQAADVLLNETMESR
ncbi:hydroxysqualene dehydroxylase HpnE [Paraburkholderia phosphatilytica]|uniref:hydroxysqualene dehydroxylase HpnE n=1 Tax=Paraburkholderia phosphatilytica TaxID=2282883 RepID=UPI000E4B09D7|nr:hydroxysqualene dehydroxylase HpnE [Paraburkholderia phosphatilytica]